MNKEYITLIDRNSAVEAIKKLNEDDLVYLNRLIIERLKLISQAKSTNLMSNFTIGDKVKFVGTDGEAKRGVIERLNKKTATIKLSNGHIWNVAPGLLGKDEG